MEDVKWLLRKCGLPILLLLIFVIAGVVCWGELHTVFFVKHFSLKKASEFPVFSKGFSLL